MPPAATGRRTTLRPPGSFTRSLPRKTISRQPRSSVTSTVLPLPPISTTASRPAIRPPLGACTKGLQACSISPRRAAPGTRRRPDRAHRGIRRCRRADVRHRRRHSGRQGARTRKARLGASPRTRRWRNCLTQSRPIRNCPTRPNRTRPSCRRHCHHCRHPHGCCPMIHSWRRRLRRRRSRRQGRNAVAEDGRQKHEKKE